MKKIFLLLLFALLGVNYMYAQSQLNAERRAHLLTERMHKYANFSPEQKSQVYAINLDIARRMLQVQEQLKTGALTPRQASEQRKSLNQERESRIVAILTPQQRNMYEEIKRRRTQKGAEQDYEAIAPHVIRGR